MAKFIFYDDYLMNILRRDERPSGGAAVQTFGWVRGLSKVGHEIYILTGSGENVTLKEDCQELNIIPLFDRNKGVRWIRWLYYRMPYLYKQVKAIKPDYLYQSVPGWQSFLIGSMCSLLKIRFILRISNDNIIDNRTFKEHSKISGYIMHMGFRQSFCILCQNEYQYNNVKQKFPDKLVWKLPNPVLLEATSYVRPYQERTYIAWVGSFRFEKNLKLLYQIASELKDEQFRVAGKELPKIDQETKEYLSKLRELPNVHFVGFLERHEIQPFLSEARFLLNTSHYEGFSNTFLEAMTVGTPIISSIHVNPDAIITNHHIGFTYKSPQDLRDQLYRISPGEFHEMSDNAVNYVLQNHDYEVLAKRLVSLLSTN